MCYGVRVPLVPPPCVQGSSEEGGPSEPGRTLSKGQAPCGDDVLPHTANDSSRTWGKGCPGERTADLGYLGSFGDCRKASETGEGAQGEAIQPLDVQAVSSYAALTGTGRPARLRIDTSCDRSDGLQTPCQACSRWWLWLWQETLRVALGKDSHQGLETRWAGIPQQ